VFNPIGRIVSLITEKWIELQLLSTPVWIWQGLYFFSRIDEIAAVTKEAVQKL
jgi:hypothetical protein